jgi:tellurium resistance protein TerD
VSITLTKGANVSLTAVAGDLRHVTVGLGWAASDSGIDLDLDASALMLGNDGKVLSDQHFVFYQNLTSPEGSVRHNGDELRGGSGTSDDETIDVDLSMVPAECASIVFPVSIYNGPELGLTFGRVRHAYIRVMNAEDGTELPRFDLGEAASSETAMIFGELYRRGGVWKFRAIGQGYVDGLRGIVTDYGVEVDD